jgi:hypothetical protein
LAAPILGSEKANNQIKYLKKECLMKKVFLGILFITITVLCFSQNKTGWINIGLGYDNQWESSGSPEVKAYMGSFAVILGSYDFKAGRNIGFFLHNTLLFPYTGTLEADGTKVTVDFSSYDFIMGLSSILGPGFKFNLNEKMLLNFGIGPDIQMLFATSENARQLGFILGLGGDIGIKFDITDLIAINLGSTISYSFASYIIGSNTLVGGISGWAKNYSLVGVKPYVCLSLNRFYDSSNKIHYGKAGPSRNGR